MRYPSNEDDGASSNRRIDYSNETRSENSLHVENLQYDDEFIVLDLDDKFDVILGLPWLRKYEPRISWQHRSVKMPATCSSDGHLMNVLERPQACGCPTSECDGLTCGTVVSTTAQDHGGISNPTVELAAGGCAKTQAAPKVHHSNKSSGLRQECTPSGRHSRSIPVAQKGQHDDPRSSIDSTVEDPAVIAQSQSEGVEGISTHVLDEEAPQAANSEVIRLQHTEGIIPR